MMYQLEFWTELSREWRAANRGRYEVKREAIREARTRKANATLDSEYRVVNTITGEVVFQTHHDDA